MKQYLVHYAVYEACGEELATSELHGVVYRRINDNTDVVFAPSISYIYHNYAEEHKTENSYIEILAISCLDD